MQSWQLMGHFAAASPAASATGPLKAASGAAVDASIGMNQEGDPCSQQGNAETPMDPNVKGQTRRDSSKREGVGTKMIGNNGTGHGKDWIAWLKLPNRIEPFVKTGGTALLGQVHRAMFLGASAVLVLASLKHPSHIISRLETSLDSLFKRPVVILRATDFNVSLLVQALAKRLRASARVLPLGRRLKAARAAGAAGAGGAGVVPWSHCGRSSSFTSGIFRGGVFGGGVVCMGEPEVRVGTPRTSTKCLDNDIRIRDREAFVRTRLKAVNGFVHLWNVLYSVSISLCLYLLLKVRGQSRSFHDDFVPPVYDGEKDVEIALKRLARDALRAMPILRHQAPPRRAGQQSESDDNDGDSPTCSICLCDYGPNQRVRVLPCLHAFHTRCADPWLVNHRTCPLCKLNIVDHMFGPDKN